MSIILKKFVLVWIVFTVYTLNTSAQTPASVAWNLMVGGDEFEQNVNIIATADSGFLVFGHTISGQSGDKTMPSYGWADIWILKYDSYHNEQWQRAYGGSESEWPVEIIQLPDGGYFLAGVSASGISGTKTDSCRGITDIWLIRLDANGNQIWDKSIGGTLQDQTTYLQQLPNGNYLLGATSKSSVSGEKSEICQGAEDYWVMELDTMGSILWQNTIGGNDRDILLGIVPVSPNGYFLVGNSESGISGDKAQGSQGGSDMWCVRLDNTGNNIVSQFSQGNAFTIAPAVVRPVNGNSFLVGSHYGALKELNFAGNTVNVLFGNCCPYPGSPSSNPYFYMRDFAKTPDGGYLIGYHTNLDAVNNYKSENCKGSTDYWVVKLDSNYNKLWDKTVGGISSDMLSAVCGTLNGEFLVAGIAKPIINGDITYANALGNNYWIVSVDDKVNTLTGKIFADLNSNNIQDTLEPDLPQIKVSDSVTNDFTFSNQLGNFRLHTRNTNLVEINTSPLNYFTAVPVLNNATFTGYLQTDSLNDFYFQPNGIFDDLVVSLTPLSNFRNNFSAYYAIKYRNEGTTTIPNPVITFFPDTSISFIFSVPPPTTVTADSIIWNMADMAPFSSGLINVEVKVDLGILNGTPIYSAANISPVITDYTPANNYSLNKILVTGSFDPNNMLVSPDTILDTQMANPPYLDYIINFQNEGNDTAFNVSVHTMIPSDLDLNTFELIGSSHSMNLNFVNHSRTYEFIFPNILLPDEDTNELLSHGYVRYRIRPVAPMTSFQPVSVNAAIFFDYNEPVLTDSAKVYIVTPVDVLELYYFEKQIKLIPNPATDNLTIEAYGLTGSSINLEILNVMGKSVKKVQLINLENRVFEKKISLASLKKGIYFLSITDDNAKMVKRLVKL